jgi:V/A-type H+-transporting ATPase subunit D
MSTRKLRLTRLELKRHRDHLERFERYLPSLRLKQQQLQMCLLSAAGRRQQAERQWAQAREKVRGYEAVFADRAGADVRGLGAPREVITSRENVAGVNLPVLQDVVFAKAAYSLFATAPWVDQAVADLREISRRHAELAVLDERRRLLRRELTRITQRVNLFEKVMIPRARHAIRVIQIHLGDEQTAAVARAKIAKARLVENGQDR